MLSQVVSWLLSVATTLYTTLPTWGYIGLAIIAFPIMRKLVNLAKKIFSF